ncbi:MAG: exo-alpha-sialidase [Anaerolineae bacterium]|nr:exo-alpha-sialidase [Anaerolineae bacterium]
MWEDVPGVVIHHVPARTEQYVGCPSIVILPSGEYVASHSHFGPGARNTDSWIYRSRDRGRSWECIAELHGQIWSNLFVHEGDLYIMGTDHCDNYGGRLNGRIVIRRSVDGGRTWSEPRDEFTGLLTDADGYHTAPVPVITHRGRLWRAMEFAPTQDRGTWRAFVMSASVDADLLRRDSWTFSEQYAHSWSRSQWIEGNVVVAPDGEVWNVLRTNPVGQGRAVASAFRDRAVILHVSPDGRHLSHDRQRDIIDMPGGGVKFTIRYDPETQRYCTLVNKQSDPEANRNALYLIWSRDLRSWHVAKRLLFHPDPDRHAFQYVDWVFDGEDIIYVSRTAYDDGMGGAHDFHDANFLTFHRLPHFRDWIK